MVDEFVGVYDGNGAAFTDIHEGLYVDGSVMPGARGVNPPLTIVAQALKTLDAGTVT